MPLKSVLLTVSDMYKSAAQVGVSKTTLFQFSNFEIQTSQSLPNYPLCFALNYRLFFYIGKPTGKYYRRFHNHLLFKNFLAFLGTEHAHSGTKHA